MAPRLDGYASGNRQGLADNRPVVGRACVVFSGFFLGWRLGGRAREHCHFWLYELATLGFQGGRAEEF